ncbi:MAG TPA: ribosomal protein S18-alanine N-acetyltransferase [Anaerolineales bacterium]|nr:ribosomal protein S18-alanine N-acetyltransferase [Anaerolineales bacterium]
MKVLIRRMTVDDVPVAAQLDRMSFSLPWPEHAFYYEVKDNSAARCFVAETEDRKVIAMIVSWVILDELHIATLAVHPDYRRQGIGARILMKALQDGYEAGTRYALLEVRAGNAAAQNLYRKFGFKAAGRRPRYYKDNGEDAILMNLDNLESI